MKIALILIGAAWMVCATVEAQGKGKASKSVLFLVYTHHVGVIFNWLFKVILYYINFFSLLSSISQENSHHLKPIEPQFCASFRFKGGTARILST